MSEVLALVDCYHGGPATGTMLADLPFVEELVVEEWPGLRQEPIIDSHGEVIDVEIVEDGVIHICQFTVAQVCARKEDFKELLDVLSAEDFVLKRQYNIVRSYMEELEKRKNTEESIFSGLLKM
jgi:hypothetical protein